MISSLLLICGISVAFFIAVMLCGRHDRQNDRDAVAWCAACIRAEQRSAEYSSIPNLRDFRLLPTETLGRIAVHLERVAGAKAMEREKAEQLVRRATAESKSEVMA